LPFAFFIFRNGLFPICIPSATPVMTPATAQPRRYSFYSPEMQLVAESEYTTSATPAMEYEYIYFNGHPIAQEDVGTATTHWTFTDHLGTPILQTTATGAVDWQAEYEPYGAVYAIDGTDRHQPLRFPGQEAEQLGVGGNGVSERTYNIFRWYRAGWGRYTQGDPIGLEAGTNPYRYSLANPLTIIDATGLTVCKSCDDCPSGKWKIEDDSLFGGPGLTFGGVIGFGRTTTYATYACMGGHREVHVVTECTLGAHARRGDRVYRSCRKTSQRLCLQREGPDRHIRWLDCINFGLWV
jgi:RHS repeat-associated protein